MTQTILIGKGRRITLDELRATSKYGADVRLEMQLDAPPEDAAPADTTDELSLALSQLVLADGDLLSSAATKATLTLLALTLCQGRVLVSQDCGAKYELATRIVDLVNLLNEKGGDGFRLPVDPAKYARSLVSLLGDKVCPDNAFLVGSGENKVAKAFVGRVISLARIALSLSLGEFFLLRSSLQSPCQ